MRLLENRNEKKKNAAIDAGRCTRAHHARVRSHLTTSPPGCMVNVLPMPQPKRRWLCQNSLFFTLHARWSCGGAGEPTWWPGSGHALIARLISFSGVTVLMRTAERDYGCSPWRERAVKHL
mmetsp:Transcript_1114/g.2109  ORF Transcript_1114/g.2109 Transcript_1114/m.2109 type:complete len:121 (-) Transcript_1114:30-392(-)